jgi:hypothetical protein
VWLEVKVSEVVEVSVDDVSVEMEVSDDVDVSELVVLVSLVVVGVVVDVWLVVLAVVVVLVEVTEVVDSVRVDDSVVEDSVEVLVSVDVVAVEVIVVVVPVVVREGSDTSISTIATSTPIAVAKDPLETVSWRVTAKAWSSTKAELEKPKPSKTESAPVRSPPPATLALDPFVPFPEELVALPLVTFGTASSSKICVMTSSEPVPFPPAEALLPEVRRRPPGLICTETTLTRDMSMLRRLARLLMKS